MRQTLWIMPAVLALALAACTQEDKGPLVEIRGGGFLFNYRIGEATEQVVLVPLKTLPDGLTLEGHFQNPAGGEAIVVSQTVSPKARRIELTTPPLKGIKADTPYKATLRLVSADGKELQTLEKEFRSQLDQSVLPDKPLTIGPGYYPNPQLPPPTTSQ